MAFYNPLFTEQNDPLQRSTGLLTQSTETTQPSDTQMAPVDNDIISFDQRIDELAPWNSTPEAPVDDDIVSIEDRERQLMGEDAYAQELWARFNRPEDEVPLSSGQQTIGGFAKRALEASQIGKSKENAKFAYGILENAVATLPEIPKQVAAGLAGIAHSALIATKNKINGGDPFAIDDAAKTIDTINKFVEYYFQSPATEEGKKIRETMGKGIEETVGAIANWGKRTIVEPTVSGVGEAMGPTAAGVTAGTLTVLPELGSYILAKGAGSGVVKSALKNTKKAVGEAVDIGLVRPSAQVARLLGVTDEALTRFTPSITAGSVARKARYIAESGMGKGVEFSKEARWLEKEVGVKYPSQAAFDDPKSVRFFMDLAKKDPEVGLSILEFERQNAEKARQYLQGIKSHGGSPESARLEIERKRAELYHYLDQEQQAFGAERQRVLRDTKLPEVGQKIRDVFKKERKAAQNRATAILNELGDLNDDVIPTKALAQDIKAKMKPESMAEVTRKNIPSEVHKMLNAITGPKSSPFISVRELYKNRVTLRKALDSMDSALEKNYFALDRMKNIIDVVDDHLKKTIIEPGKAADIIKRFRDAYYEGVVAKYERPRTAGVRKTNVKHGDFVSNSMVAGKYVKAGEEGIDSAREFLNASNRNPGAMEAMEAYLNHNMVRSSTDSATGLFSKAKFRKWLNDHELFLEEMGLKNSFGNMKEIERRIDDAQLFVNEFEKQYVSKIIDADIDAEIDAILKSKKPIEDTNELMTIIGKNEDAVKGVQNSLIDRMESMTTENITDVKALRKFYNDKKSIYNRVFGGTPAGKQKIKMLDNYVKAMERNFRKGKLPENFSDLNPVFMDFYRSEQFSGSWITRTVRNLASIFPEFGRGNVKKIITRIAVDPEAAYMLKRFGKDIQMGRPDVANRRFRDYMIQIGVPAQVSAALETGKNIPPEQQQPEAVISSDNVMQELMQRLETPGMVQ